MTNKFMKQTFTHDEKAAFLYQLRQILEQAEQHEMSSFEIETTNHNQEFANGVHQFLGASYSIRFTLGFPKPDQLRQPSWPMEKSDDRP